MFSALFEEENSLNSEVAFEISLPSHDTISRYFFDSLLI